MEDNAVISALTLILDNNDAALYEEITKVARRAAAEDMGSTAPDMDDYRTMYKNQDRTLIETVGIAVAYFLDERLTEDAVPEPWDTVLRDVLQLHSYRSRAALGEHYLPEPDDMADLLSGEDEDEDDDVPDDFPVRPLGPDDEARDRVTCGECGRSWDDAVVTSMTPAPSARCPFEQFH